MPVILDFVDENTAGVTIAGQFAARVRIDQLDAHVMLTAAPVPGETESLPLACRAEYRHRLRGSDRLAIDKGDELRVAVVGILREIQDKRVSIGRGESRWAGSKRNVAGSDCKHNHCRFSCSHVAGLRLGGQGKAAPRGDRDSVLAQTPADRADPFGCS